MSGIRETKKNGGPMNEPQPINTVGSPLAPQGSDGRQQYALPLLAPIAMAAGRALARPFGKFVAKRIPQFFAGPNKQYGTGKKIFEAGFKKKAPTVVFEPNKFGLAFKNDPLAKTVMGGTTMVGRGIKKAGKGIYAAGKYATTTPSGIALTGATSGPFIYNALKADPAKDTDGDGISEINKKKRQIGMPENLTLGGGQNIPNIDPQLSTKSAEELKKDRIQKYRDIMDIKGMNKDAAYNSLIAASQAINESGDFKGDIKSGKLINQIIQATSKQFDKPKATKDAIDTLILKGEIEKDINASDPKSIADLAYKEAATKKLNKELKGNTTAEIIQARMLKDEMPTGSNLAGLISINNPELNIKVLPTKDLGNADPIDYMTEIVTTVNADETTPDYPAGVYVLKDKVIQITEEGSVIPVPINALK
jgi:hypothetical protein